MPRMIEICHKSKPLTKALGSIMRDARQHKSLTMRDVAEKAGVQHTQVGKIECCQRDLSVLELIHLSRCCDYDPLAIFKDILEKYDQTVGA